MIINADSLLPHLKQKVRPTQSDTSRHLLCPYCEIRTKLNTLGDGRRKCTACGKKFRIHKVTQETKLRQCAEILLCFCLDFSSLRTAEITTYRYRLVAEYYDHFRTLIAEKSLPQEKIPLLTAYKETLDIPHEKSRCRWCKTKKRTLEAGGQTPVFGVLFRNEQEVYIDPLKDEEALVYFHTLASREDALGSREGYAGFICCGKFHRFTEDEQAKSNAEQLWGWIRERIRTHHSIWKKNAGVYLKELEWRYNNRSLLLDLQAKKFIELMPMDFLTSWLLKKVD